MDDAAIGGGEEIAAAGLLLLPPQLQELLIWNCPELSLRTNSLDDGTAGGGLRSLHSLRSLQIGGCPFPTSLQRFLLFDVEGIETLAPLSNLTSLTELHICRLTELTGEGLWPLLAQGRLTELSVRKTPKFFVGSEPSRPHEQGLLRPSSKLRELRTDDVKGLLVAPICTLLSSSLTDLVFQATEEVERFTKEQEESLHLLTSLQKLEFLWCHGLQSLPAWVHRLDNLRRLQIRSCRAIRSLPKDGLPSSLQELKISECPAIRSLPKDGLPSSLRVLDVEDGNSEELRKQCRKLSGTIPIIKA